MLNIASNAKLALITILVLVQNFSVWARTPVPAPATARAPQITVEAEAVVSNTNPYVQQTVIYTVRAFSHSNVLEFTLDPPTVPGAALEPLEDKPRTYAHSSAQGQRVVNEYRYALTPLVAGRIEIPPTKLSGKAEAPGRGRGVAFKVLTKAIIFRSRLMPANAEQPWLPIQDLALINEGTIQQTRIGEPFTLSLWLNTVGVRGQRLPALVDLLQGADFRIYAEKAVEYWQDATQDGNAVRGQRHEILTIVPLKAGTWRLPVVRIPWWDINKDQPTFLEWQAPEITVIDPALPLVNHSAISIWLLTITAAALFFLFGWGVGRGQAEATEPTTVDEDDPSAGRLGGMIKRVVNGWRRIGAALLPIIINVRARWQLGYQTLVTPLKQHLILLNPWPLLMRLLPATFHTRRLLRQIQVTDNVTAIAEAFQNYATSVWECPPQTPLTRIAQDIIIANSALNGPALLALCQQLDAAIYGAKQNLDLKQWKTNFCATIRTLPHHRPRVLVPNIDNLPPLNPESDA